MDFTLVLITSFSVLLPAVMGWVRFKRIHPTFYPFIFLVWLGLLNEILSAILIHSFHHSNAVNSNIYILLEGIFLLWQFERWGNFSQKKQFFLFYLLLFLLVWLVENFYISRIQLFNSYFRIIYSGIICLMSINYLNFILVREHKNILFNSAFLICSAFIIYYAYKVAVEAFWIYGLNNSAAFRINVYNILGYINLLTNCIFTIAIAWIPAKQRFSLPS
jgi:hypothetical protein